MIFGNQNTYEKIAAYVCDTCESRKLYVLQDVFETVILYVLSAGRREKCGKLLFDRTISK